MTQELMEAVREAVAIHRYHLPESAPRWRFYAEAHAERAIIDAKRLLASGDWQRAREHLQFAADMLGGSHD